MDTSRIFITGAGGQLGTALRKQYPKAKFADVSELDITDKNSVANYDWSNIDYLINAAAYTNVDGAEAAEGRRDAWAVNAAAVTSLLKACQKRKITLIHISTDYVFDGSKPSFSEEDAYAPLSVYGASKAAADIAVATYERHYILRSSWVIGEGKNFVRTMMGLTEKNISPKVVHDQIGRLTFTSELVKAINHLLSNNSEFGTYNLTNDGPSASWADITREIFKLLGRDDLTVSNTTTAEYFAGKEGIAPRPLNSTLDLGKIHMTGFKSNNWQDDLVEYIKKEQKK